MPEAVAVVNPMNHRQSFHPADALRLEVATDLPNEDGLINMARNPSGALGPWWWWTDAPHTRVFTGGADGRYGLAVRQGEDDTPCFMRTGLMRVTAGDVIQGRWYLADLEPGHNVKTQIVVYNRDRVPILNGPLSSGAVLVAGTTYLAALTVPTFGYYVSVAFRLYDDTDNPADGASFVTSNVMVTKAESAHATPFDYVEPYAWRDIVAESTALDIKRATLNLSTLTATLTDPDLDPATDEDQVLRVGRPVHVSALVGETWEPLYTGTVRELLTRYDVDKETLTVKPVIIIEATDAVTDLAGEPCNEVHRYLSGLEDVFGAPSPETGVGSGLTVPWYFGEAPSFSSNPLNAPGAINSNASILDQVAITRDSLGMETTTGGPGGHAWVDRYGVLNLWPTPPGWAGTDLADVDASPFDTINATATEVDVPDPHGVTRTLRRLSATTPGTIGAAVPTPVRASQQVVISAWVGRSVARATRLEVTFYDRSQYVEVDQVDVDTASAETGWGYLSGTVTIPPDAHVAQVYVYVDGCAADEEHDITEVRIDPLHVIYTDTTATGPLHGTYSDIDVDYATNAVINTVNVTYLRDVLDADAEAVPYGPYKDQNSIDDNGRFPTTLTLIGKAENATAIRQTAQALLAANADPVRMVKSLLVPVLDDQSRTHVTRTDLGDLLGVEFTGLIDTLARVETIHHRITGAGWLTEYTFAPNGSQAIPQRTPNPRS